MNLGKKNVFHSQTINQHWWDEMNFIVSTENSHCSIKNTNTAAEDTDQQNPILNCRTLKDLPEGKSSF